MSGRPRDDRDQLSGYEDLPIDPDIETATNASHHPDGSPFGRARRSRWPRLRVDVLATVFFGGCVGGYARYAATEAWPASSSRFPWATLGVNVLGCFVLAIVIIVAAEVAPSRYLRPLVGTGFCGALTTFSSVAVTADLLVAHHHLLTAAAYLLATIFAGLAAASFGLVIGRAIAANRRRARQDRSPQ